MRSKIVTSFIFLIYFFVYNIALPKAKQAIGVPDIMYHPEGYFDPQIMAFDTVNAGASIILREGDCKYIFPINVFAFLAYCQKDCFSTNKEWCEDWKIELTNEHSIKCICAKQRTVCGSDYIDGAELGCIKIPNPPPPPIFYEKLPSVAAVDIVPISDNDNSFSEPKIRVAISMPGERTKYHTLDGKRNEVQNIEHKNIYFAFSTKVESGKICTSYLGYCKSKNCSINRNIRPNIQECFYLPGPKKPTIKYENGKPLFDDPDRVIDNLFEPKVILNAAEKEQCKIYNCGVGDFVAGYICKNGNREVPVCNNNGIDVNEEGLKCKDGSKNYCPPDYKVVLQYDKDPRSNLVCLAGWKPNPHEYVLAGDNRVFSETKYEFAPYKFNNKGQLERSDGQAISLKANQNVLDGITKAGPGIYSVTFDGVAKNYKYEQVVYFCRKSCIKDGFCSDVKRKIPNGEKSSLYKETTFIMDNKPYFLPDDIGDKKYSQNKCEKSLCYYPPSPYLQGLCFFKEKPVCKTFTRSDCNKEHRCNKGTFTIDLVKDNELKECLNSNFIKFEIIGQGRDGSVSMGKVSSGSSGGYAKALIETNRILGKKINIQISRQKKETHVKIDGTEAFISVGKTEKQWCEFNDRASISFLYKKCIPSRPGQEANLDRSDNKNNGPDIPLAFEIDSKQYVRYGSWCQGDDPSGNMECKNDNECEKCFSKFSTQDTSKVFGIGGCTSYNGVTSRGASGAVRITCEKWRG